MNATSSPKLKRASLGTVISGTLRPVDLLPAFTVELEYQIGRNGDFLSRPENFLMRDRMAKLIGEAQDAFNEDGETLNDEESANEIISDLIDALCEFAGPYASFGSHPGDGADFGFWPDWSSIEDLPCYDGTDKAKEAGEDGDFRVISDHGNVTVYSHDGTELLAVV